MNLTIDLGNTHIKYALFDKDKMVDFHFLDYTIPPDIEKLITEKNIRNSIVSSVINDWPAFLKVLIDKTNCIRLSHNTKTPVKNLYQTPETLGKDRLAAVIGAQKIFPGKNILVIDAGTCIKYDFLNSKGEYHGGAISPGIKMRFKALNHFTDKLPLLEVDHAFETLTGKNSTESILSGVINGVLFEAEGAIALYKKQYPDLEVVVTGGDIAFFEKRLKTGIFADPYLILKGLNEILQYSFPKK